MPSDGVVQMQALGVKLKALGKAGKAESASDLMFLGKGVSLRSQLLAGIRQAAKPAVEQARAAARDNLPKHGGLNEYVAGAQIGVYNRLSGPRVGVRIGVPKGTKRARKAYGANKGTVRHPVFKTGKWADTEVKPGWFDETLSKSTPATAATVELVCRRVAEEITRRV